MAISQHQREAEALASRLRRQNAAGGKRLAKIIKRRGGRATKNAGAFKAKAISFASILKVHKGGRAGDSYACKAEGAEFIDSNMLGRNSKERALEWDLDQARHPNVKNLFCHVSISLGGGRKLSKDEWSRFVKDFLKEIGAEGVNYVAIRHTNSDNDHVHIIFSRALPNGKILSTAHNFYKWREALRKAEELNGLKPIESTTPKELTAQSDTQVNATRRAVRRGTKPNHIDPAIVNGCLSKSVDMDDFARQLKSRGIELRFSERDNGEAARGILFRKLDADEFLAGSSLSRQLTLPKVQAALKANEQRREYEYVRAQQIQAQQRAAEQLARAKPNTPRERG